MGITQPRADRHIIEWGARLKAVGAYSYRARWPLHLFHHSPIENAAVILTQDKLLSRSDSVPYRRLDIAGAAVIQHRDRAHQFGRLYFRPRTPTQYWIEGIRKPDEYYDGNPNTHAPTLVMFVFDSRKILIQDEVRFSTGNMQSLEATDGDDDQFFDGIDFAKVYHEGRIGGDRSITHCKCAEVLVPSPLPISDCLKAVICRSVAERLTLLNEMGDSVAERWSRYIHVSDDLRVFGKRYTFVETVSLQHDGVAFKLHPAGKPVNVRVQVWDETGKLVASVERPDTPVVPPSGGGWLVRSKLTDGLYRVQITIEGCRAFEGRLLLAEGAF